MGATNRCFTSVFAAGSALGFFEHFVAENKQNEQEKCEDQHGLNAFVFCEKIRVIDRWELYCNLRATSNVAQATVLSKRVNELLKYS